MKVENVEGEGETKERREWGGKSRWSGQKRQWGEDGRRE